MNIKLNGYAPWVMVIIIILTTAGGILIKTGGVKERIITNVREIAENTRDIKELDKKFNQTLSAIVEDMGAIKQALGVK